MLEHKSDAQVAALARYALRQARLEIASTLLWNAEHLDQRPKDLEFWRCAAYYGRKIITAHRAGKPIDARWAQALECGDALPEY